MARLTVPSAVFLYCCLVSSAYGTQADEVDFYPVHNVRFGVDLDNNAWFEFIDENGERVRYEGMQHMPDLFAQDLKTSTYSIHRKKSDWATLTILDEETGLITATVHRSGRITTVAPRRDYEYLRVHPEKMRILSTAKHVLTYHTGPWGGGSCLAKHIDENTAVAREAKNRSADIDVLSRETGRIAETPRPRPSSRRLQRAPRWGNCYSGEGSTRYLDVGLVIDRNFYETYGSKVDRTMKAIEAIIANTNLVYFYTFNMFIRVRQVVIPLSGGSSRYEGIVYSMFNQNLASCSLDIRSTLDGMSFFAETLPIKGVQSLLPTTDREDDGLAALAHWHLLTACYSSGTVGVAYVGTLCRTNNFNVGNNLFTAVNVGVSSRTFEGVTWLTFAHELGHAFNADHSFEEGEGKTGGIMDYGDGTLHGIYQFNEKYRRGEVCNFLQSMVLERRCRKSSAIDYFPPVSPQPCTSGSLCAGGTGECREGICELGELMMRLTADGTTTYYPFLQAPWGGSPFSTLAEVLTTRVVVGTPSTGCSAPPTNDAYVGAIVVVDRSRQVCTFQRKAELAEAAGAAALIIVNDVNDVIPMVAEATFSTDIPVVMVALNAGNDIKNIVSGASNLSGSLGMVIFPHPEFTFSPTFLGGPPTPPADIIGYLVENVFPYTAAGFGSLAAILFLYGFCFQPPREKNYDHRTAAVQPHRFGP